MILAKLLNKQVQRMRMYKNEREIVTLIDLKTQCGGSNKIYINFH